MLFTKIALIGFTKAIVIALYTWFTEWLEQRRKTQD